MRLFLVFLVACSAAPRSGGSTTGGFTCPVGTRSAHSDGNNREARWCEKPDGTLHGPYVERRNRDRLVGAYKDGVPDGRWEGFDRTGKRVGSFEIVDGTGTMIYWNDKGEKAREVPYRAGKLDGTETNWYDGGKLLSQGNWKEGLRTGKWTWWYPNGTKNYEADYEDGRYHGFLRRYSIEGGAVTEEETYVHGERTAHVVYDKGKVVSKEEWPLEVPPEGDVVTRGHAKIDPAWQACREHHECELVTTGCCACGAEDYVAVHHKHYDEAAKALAYQCTEACPQMRCQRVWARCVEGACVTSN